MCGAIPPLPNTPSWRGAELSTGTNLPLFTFSLRVTDKISHPYKTRNIILDILIFLGCSTGQENMNDFGNIGMKVRTESKRRFEVWSS
jgi:hypothetical protein